MYSPEMKRNIINGTMKKFVTAKGKDYYLYLGVLDKHLGDDLVARVSDIKAKSEWGGISYAALIHLLVEFEFPSNRMKSMLDILYRRGAIHGGYERYIRKFGVEKTLTGFNYQKCNNPDCWRWCSINEQCKCEV